MDVIVGTAGHIDHGKTALVKALTGVDADRLPEEKQRGITIDLGFAELELGNGLHAAFIDVPGHERFIKNMLAGAGGIDIVLLVVAADEGVMPQTREHFAICRLLNIRHGLVAVTKCDLVDEEMLELVREEISELVKGSVMEKAPVVSVSSRNGDGIGELKRLIENLATLIDRPKENSSEFLPIDRAFTIRGFGTVVTGTLASGEITVGGELELLPGSRRVRVRGLQSHGRHENSVSAGRRVAVNLGGIAHDEIERGDVLAAVGVLRPTQIINAEVEMLASAPRPLRSRQRVRVHIGTAEILARVAVPNDVGEIEPGDRGHVQLRLESPTVSRFNDRFILRAYSPQTTIGGGKVLDPLAEKTRRKQLPELIYQLSKLSNTAATESDILQTFIDTAGSDGILFSNLQARTGWRRELLASTLKTLSKSFSFVNVGDVGISAKGFESIKATLLAKLTEHHKRDPLSKGVPREELRAKIPVTFFNAALHALNEERKIETSDERISLPSKGGRLSADEAKVRHRFVQSLAGYGLQVPKIGELIITSVAGTPVSELQARRILKLLYESGEAVKVTEELVFSGTVIAGLADKLRQFAEAKADRSIDVSVFKELAGISRKYAIPLLEYFDREKVTLRVGEKRVIR